MNKSKMLMFSIIFLGLGNNLQAGAKTSKTTGKPMAIKHKSAGEMMPGEMMPIEPKKTLEEQHMVIPIGQRQKAAQKVICSDIRRTVAQKLMALVENSGSNLIKGIPNVTKGANILTLVNPETQEFVKIYYTPQTPVRVINNKDQHIHELHELFNSLENEYSHCGLKQTKMPAGARMRIKGDVLAWYELNPGVIGGPRTYLILEDIKPSMEMVETYETSMKQ